MPEKLRTSYVILSQPRTGSTLLASLLRHRGLGDPDEYLNADRIERLWPSFAGPDAKYDVHRYLQLLKENRSSAQGWFGIKVHYFQLIKPFAQLGNIRNFVLSFDRIIVLNRKDKLAQAVSTMKAEQTGNWGSSPSDKDPFFDPLAISDAIRRSIFHDRQVLRMKLGNARPVLFLTYEELRDSTDAIWQRVQEYLGVTPEPLDRDAIREKPQRDHRSAEFERQYLAFIRGMDPQNEAS